LDLDPKILGVAAWLAGHTHSSSTVDSIADYLTAAFTAASIMTALAAREKVSHDFAGQIALATGAATASSPQSTALCDA
jgi:hypothetical protein